MTKFLQLLIPGIVSGGIYGVMSSGLILTYETSGIFNFSHGAVAFTVAYLFFQLNTGQGLPIWLSAVLSILIFAPLLGFLLDRVLLRRLASAPVYARIVGTIGLLVALPNLALWIVQQINQNGGALPTSVGLATAPGLGPTPPSVWSVLNNVPLTSDQIAVFAAAAVVAVGLWLLLRHTRLGLLMRADVDRRDLAVLRGVDSGRVSSIAWALTMMLAGLGGVLLGPTFGLDNLTFTLVVLGSMAAVVFAGLRSLPLAFVGGILLGVFQNLTAGYDSNFLPSALTNLAGFRTSLPFIMAVLGLMYLAYRHRKTRRAQVTADDRPPATDLQAQSQWRRLIFWGVAVAALLIYTLFFASVFWSGLIAQGMSFALIFLSFVVVTGIGGMVSLAQASFVTIGAFMAGWILNHQFADNVPLLISNGHLNFVVALIAGAVAAAIIGALVAVPIRRLGALELALATLAIGFVGDLVVFQISSVSNGSNGWTLPAPSLGPFHFSDARSMTVLLLIVFGAMTWMIRNLRRSAFGRNALAARSSDVAARTSGISPDRVKIMVFALAAGIAGIGGVFYGVEASPFSNQTAPTLTGLLWLAIVITWGIRRPGGALLAGLSVGIGTNLFAEITSWNTAINTATQSSYFLPILFGLGAIQLAKEPDGILTLLATQRGTRKRKRLERRARKASVGIAPQIAAVQVTTEPVDGATSGLPLTPAVERVNGSMPSYPLRLAGIHAEYDGVEVLHGVDLTIKKGEIVALFGPNGAGKSTLCRIAAGMLPATQGQVWRGDSDITRLAAHRRARQGLLLAPEGRGIFPGLTVEENLAMWLPSPKDRDRACEEYPILSARRHQLAGNLSGGEQQLLTMAGALVRPPDVFLADEPTLGLAPQAAAAVCAALGALRDRGSSILLVAEKANEVLKLADSVVIMTLGTIAWAGPKEELDAGRLAAAYLGNASPAVVEPPGN